MVQSLSFFHTISYYSNPSAKFQIRNILFPINKFFFSLRRNIILGRNITKKSINNTTMQMTPRIYLTSIIFLLKIILTQCASPISIDNYRDINLQSHNIQLIQVDSGSYNSIVTFKNVKLSTLVPYSNIIMGILQMNYDANHNISGQYQVRYQLVVTSVSLTDLSIGLTHNVGDMKSIKVAVLIVANQWKYKMYMFGYKGVYNNGNSFYVNTPTPFVTNTSLRVYAFLNGIFGRQTIYTSSRLGFQFIYTTSIVSSFANINSLIISSYNLVGPYTMSILVMDMTFINSVIFTITPIGVYQYTTYPISYLNYNSDASQVLMGLGSFYFAPYSGNKLNGLYWTVTYPSNTSVQFTYDDQISQFQYGILIFNNYGCRNSSYPILGLNVSIWQCYDSCYSSQYEYFNYYYWSYMCSFCNSLCVGCYSYNYCKQCVVGYVLQVDGSCLLNTSYFIYSTSYDTRLCSYNHTGCEQCTTYGHKCLTCASLYYVSSSGYQSYTVATVVNGTTIYPSYTVLAVTCNLCNTKFQNCLTCNSSMCFTCQLPYQLITPTICGLSSTPIIPIIKPCSDIHGCKKCLQTALDDCLQCNNSELTLMNGKCISPCGDGIILDDQVCDDQNTLSFDGCSSDCMSIQQGWQCFSLIPNKASYCRFSSSIPLVIRSIVKTDTQNKLTIILSNSIPYIREWMQFDSKHMKKIMVFEIDGFKTSYAYQQDDFEYSVGFVTNNSYYYQPLLQSRLSQLSTRTLQDLSTDTFNPQYYRMIELTIYYNHSIMSMNHQQARIIFSPLLSQIKMFETTTQFQLNFSLYTDDNHVIQYYMEDYHQRFAMVKVVAMVVGVVMLGIVTVSTVSWMIDGNNSMQMLLTVETSHVVQFTYFSLLGIGELNPLFIAVADGLRFSNGLDINIINDPTQNRILRGVDIQSTNVLNNVNLSLVLPVALIFVGLILLIISKVRTKKEQRQSREKSPLMDFEGQEVLGTQKKEQNKLCKLQDLSKIFFVNLGFGLMLFFLYKYIISILIQITLGKMQGISFAVISIIGLMLLAFIMLILFKFDLFSKLTQKLSFYFSLKDKILMQDANHAEYIQNGRLKKRKIYLIILIFERIINSVTLILFFNSSFKLHALIPIIVSFIQIVYISFYNTEIYNPPHKFRLYFNYCIFISIQILLLIRKLLLQNNGNTIGIQESNYGLYLPYTVLILLFLVELNAIVFMIYSIKRTRCCQLQIQWQRMNKQIQDEISKQKLNQNIRTAMQISKKLENQDCERIIQDSQKQEQSIRTHNDTILLVNDDTNREIQQQKDDKIDNNKQNRQNQFVQQKLDCMQRQLNQLNNNNEEGKQISNKEIKKQLKHLLKGMRITGTQCKKNKNNQQEIRKNRSYHYTNQRIYNVYDEYNMI